MQPSITPRDWIYSETIGSIILGGVPAAFIAYSQGVEPLFEFIQTLNPPENITYYLSYLVFVYFFVKKFKKSSYSKSDTIMQLKNKTCDGLVEVSLSIQGVFRAMAGAILVIIPPILIVELTSRNIVISILAYLFAITIIYVSSCVTHLANKN
jgi:hypothetical protein